MDRDEEESLTKGEVEDKEHDEDKDWKTPNPMGQNPVDLFRSC